MNIDNTHDTAENAGQALAPQVVDIRHISPDQLAQLGLGGLAYVKPVTVDGVAGYAIHAADGRPMALVPEREVALAAILQNEMVPALVH